MKREEQSWDFLFDCNENQWQLIGDIVGEEAESLADVVFDLEADGFPKHYAAKVRENANTRKGVLFYEICSDEEGYYLTYGEFLNRIIDDMDDKPQTKLLSSEKFEREENIILLYCLRKLALEQPEFFKSLYNLASTSAEDVVEELEIRFCTSPALRACLPAVLCSCMAKEQSIQLSCKGKKAIDENLTGLEESSLLGNYHYAGSLGKLNSLNSLWALGGPVGMLIGMAYHVGKDLFSDNDKSEKEDEVDEEVQEDCTFALACALIMLRRDVFGIFWNEKQAYNNVCKWMDMNDFSLSAEGHNRQEKAFVETLFLKILKEKDKEKYRLVMNSYGYTEERHTRIDNKIETKIKLLLPHAAYLVEKLWDKLFADHSKDYYYTLPQLSARMVGKTCLVTEFAPDFVDNENRVHFLVDDTSRGAIMLCLELMGHDSTVVCKDLAALNKEYDHIFVSNDTQRDEMRSYLNPRSLHGRVYCFYANFAGITKNEACGDSEIVKLREELRKAKEELKECKEQIAEYKVQIAEYEDEAKAFRHDKMNNEFFNRSRTFVYRIQKGKDIKDIKKNADELEKELDKVHAYVDEYAKYRKAEEFSLWNSIIGVFCGMEGIEIVQDNQCNDDSIVKIKKNMFIDRVLCNIKRNILQHAFPENHGITNPRVKISLRHDEKSRYVLTIENNGLPFQGDWHKVLEQGVSYGNSTGEGLYLAARCMKEYHKGCDIIPYTPEDEYTFAIQLIITNQ